MHHTTWFRFTLNGTKYDLYSDARSITFPTYGNEFEGSQTAPVGPYPMVDMKLVWPFRYRIKDSDIVGSAGKTLYYDHTTIYPQISFSTANTYWTTGDTDNINYNVKITNVAYLQNDTLAGEPVAAYMISGTCSAVISSTDSTSIFSAGEFNMIMSRMNF